MAARLEGAGFALDVKADLREVRKMLTKVERQAVDKAAQQGLNRTINSVRGEVVNDLYRETGIQKKQIRQRLLVRKAMRNRLIAVLDASDAKAVNLIEFVSQANRKPGVFNRRLKSGKYKHEGVKAKAWGKQRTYKGTFIGTSKGKPLVFVRTSKARAPIKSVSGPSLRKTFVRDVITSAMRSHASKRWPIEFERALNNELQKIRAR